MTIAGDSFLTDETLLWRESELRSSTLDKRDAFTSANARRHFNEGFVRRHYMLQSSRLFLSQHCRQGRKEPLSPYEATDCAIHLNAYYLNLRGTLDNLAWVLQYEWQLLAGVMEEGGRGRQACSLFGPRFLAALKSQQPKLALCSSSTATGQASLLSFVIRRPTACRFTFRLRSSLLKSR